MRILIILASEILKKNRKILKNNFEKFLWRKQPKASSWVINKSIGFVPTTLLNVMAEQQVNGVSFSLRGLDPKPMAGLVLTNAKLKQNMQP